MTGVQVVNTIVKNKTCMLVCCIRQLQSLSHLLLNLVMIEIEVYKLVREIHVFHHYTFYPVNWKGFSEVHCVLVKFTNSSSLL